MGNKDYTIEIKTGKSGVFRQLVEGLKESLIDVNWEFSPTGIRILDVNNGRTIIVHMKLDAENFEYYKCIKKEIIGLNMSNLFKIFKTVTNYDTLTLFMEKGEENTFGIIIENGDKNTKTTYRLKTLDINLSKISIPEKDFDSKLVMLSSDFQKIIRDMKTISDCVEISCVGKQLSFKCEGDYADQETVIFQNDTDIKIESNDDIIFQGVYNLDSLLSFTKCTGLCKDVELYMVNNFPLTIRYNVGVLGEIKFCLNPKSKDI